MQAFLITIEYIWFGGGPTKQREVNFILVTKGTITEEEFPNFEIIKNVLGEDPKQTEVWHALTSLRGYQQQITTNNNKRIIWNQYCDIEIIKLDTYRAE